MVISAGAFVSTSRQPMYPARRALDLNGVRTSYAQIYRSQPAVRTVVGFVARNIAGIGFHLFERTDDNNRIRVRTGPLADLLANPMPEAKLSQYAWVYRMVSDLAIYDEHYTVISQVGDSLRCLPVPVADVTPVGGSFFAPDEYLIWGNYLPAESVLAIVGYSPSSLTSGTSPLEALRQTLAADSQAEKHREEFWERGARLSGVISRPADAPQWSDNAQQRFRRQWRDRYSAGGEDAGGTPILEDGMSYAQISSTARDAQYLESRKLTREEVAAAYHVAPPMVGILDNANYSNVKEFHSQLYQDTLGPTLQQIDQAIDLQMGDLQPGTYAEFNIMEKLAGSFEEQAKILSSAVGGPWMTRNEARARMNMPLVDGGDELITPLNVVAGGLASPRDTDPTKSVEPVQVKAGSVRAEVTDRDLSEMVKVFRSVFARQRQVMMSRQKSVLDRSRWDDEVASDLLAGSLRLAEGPVEAIRRAADIDRGVLSTAPMAGWLSAKARAMAVAVNDETDRRLAAGDELEAVFGDDRDQTARNMALAVVGFAFIDAAKRADYGTKTWHVTSPNSRHPQLNGETVPLDGVFSSGNRWPGDSAGSADQSANCHCYMTINPKG